MDFSFKLPDIEDDTFFTSDDEYTDDEYLISTEDERIPLLMNEMTIFNNIIKADESLKELKPLPDIEPIDYTPINYNKDNFEIILKDLNDSIVTVLDKKQKISDFINVIEGLAEQNYNVHNCQNELKNDSVNIDKHMNDLYHTLTTLVDSIKLFNSCDLK